MFELKKIDLIIYVQIPLELNIARTESRDKRKFNNQELKYLKQLKINMEEELQNLSNDISVLVLDGNQKPQDNFVKIKEKVLELKK